MRSRGRKFAARRCGKGSEAQPPPATQAINEAVWDAGLQHPVRTWQVSSCSSMVGAELSGAILTDRLQMYDRPMTATGAAMIRHCRAGSGDPTTIGRIG